MRQPTGNGIPVHRTTILALLCLLLGLPGGSAAGEALQELPTIVGEPDRGRSLFNGIGGCFNCHGYDGESTRLPRHAPKLAEELARLTPPPADLRDPSRLKSQTDLDRLRSIRFGHPGTAMFPKIFLSERELADLVAYVTTLGEKAVDAERGRLLFNGKGSCAYCHGLDGHADRRPTLRPQTEELIARLNPKPTDLRRSGSLLLPNDTARFRAIREGHPGTGMFPDTTLTDEEIRDLLAYLALLRTEATADGRKKP